MSPQLQILSEVAAQAAERKKSWGHDQLCWMTMQPISLMMDPEKGRSVPRYRAGAAGAWVCLLTLLTSW